MAKHDTRHGGAYDRGRADSYYQRPFTPHMYTGDSYSSEEITEESMRPDEIAAYRAGYDDNEKDGIHKDWG